MDFWRRSARISRKDKIRNNNIKQKMNVTRSLLEDIKTKQLKWYGHVQRMEEGRLPKKLWNGAHQEEENEVDLNLPRRKGLEDWRGKGINGRRLEWQRQMEEDNIIVKWAQEDVETSYNLLNNNNNNNKLG